MKGILFGDLELCRNIIRILLEIFKEDFTQEEIQVETFITHLGEIEGLLFRTLKGDISYWQNHAYLELVKKDWETTPWVEICVNTEEYFRHALIADVVMRACVLLLDVHDHYQLRTLRYQLANYLRMLHDAMSPLPEPDPTSDIEEHSISMRRYRFEIDRSLTNMAFCLRGIVNYFPFNEEWLKHIAHAFSHYPQPNHQHVPYELPFDAILDARPVDFESLLKEFPMLQKAFVEIFAARSIPLIPLHLIPVKVERDFNTSLHRSKRLPLVPILISSLSGFKSSRRARTFPLGPSPLRTSHFIL